MTKERIYGINRTRFYNREMHYDRKRTSFQTPFDGDEYRARIGQPFEIVGVDVSDEWMIEGGGGPKFDIRFPDGFVMKEADELEVFEGAGWEPDQN